MTACPDHRFDQRRSAPGSHQRDRSHDRDRDREHSRDNKRGYYDKDGRYHERDDRGH